MTRPATKRLSDASIVGMFPGQREYTVWDSKVPGLGVRVRPSGGRSFVLLRNIAGRSRRVSLGPVETMTVEEARRTCLVRQANPEPQETPVPRRQVPLFRDFVAGAWKEAHFDNYKASTQRSVQTALARQLLPVFGSRPLDSISPASVRRWFDRRSRTAPGGANHDLGLFRQIMNFAVACGHIDANPTQSVRTNRRPALTRFLSREEVHRLHEVLDRQTRKGAREQADIIRLLLLTGCRRGEIVRLRWSEVQSNMLALTDSKTGARKVPLNSQAQSILRRRPKDESPFVFPSPLDPTRPRSIDLSFWYRARQDADIDNVRLHDLRHTYASHAVMNGVPLPVVSRMLGHSSVTMTLRYAHLADRDVEAAAERVGRAVASIMDIP